MLKSNIDLVERCKMSLKVEEVATFHYKHWLNIHIYIFICASYYI